ncbi:MAG: glycosyltransferase family 39 protein [Elusimicrobiota bacterium]
MSAAARRELGIVLAFVCLLFIPFSGKAFHMDEPLFLAPARHITTDPLHPLDFQFNWYGRSVPMSAVNNTPPLMLYALAGAIKLSGEREAATRLLFLPFDLLAAAALYFLARRFLSRPLMPVLIVIASPAYMICLNLLYPEKLAAAFGFCGLYALVRGVDEEQPRWFWGSATLLMAALLSKYAAVLFLLPAAGYALHRGVPPRRVVLHLALCGAGLAAWLAWDLFTSRSAAGAAWQVTSQAAGLLTSSWPHKLRSTLAFAGGCGVVTAFWPWLAFRGSVWLRGSVAGFCLLLFAPGLDLAPLVRPLDRATGLLLSAGALFGLYGLFSRAGRARGGVLWAYWAVGVLLLLLFLYWSILARLVVFMIPPLVFSAAEALEAEWPAARLRRLYGVSLGLTLVLSLALAWVDLRYADAQRSMAAQVAREYAGSGRKVWFDGHWGLQYYLERAGAEQLDGSRGGWELVKPGDVVIVPRVNSNLLSAKKKVLADVGSVEVGSRVPLRLISGWAGEGGFYSNTTGFLPYSLSGEPLEEFSVVELVLPSR